MTAKLFTLPKQVPFTNAGALIPGAQAYFYINGTTTPQDTYTTSDLVTPHSNPVVADGEGKFPAIYFNDELQYKLVLTDSDDVEIYTEDNFTIPPNPQDPTADESAAGVTPTDYSYDAGIVKRYGAVGDGIVDDSTAMINAHLVGDKVTYPKGDYLFTSTTNPDFTNGVELINAEVNSATRDNILRFDRSGELIGLQMNHLQETSVALPITTGTSTTPPVSTATINGPVEVIAHWYQDFGREYTRVSGSPTWYTWEWAHTTATEYDTQRVPVQGYYRGDDPNVLDWQCYWLREAGITGVTIVGTGDLDTSTWAAPADEHHWVYELMNNAPNFKGLKYALWMPYTASPEAVWTDLIDNVYRVYPNFYTVEHNGGTYPVVYCFELATLVTNLGGEASFQTFCDTMTAKFQADGYAGMAIFGRHAMTHETVDRYDIENNHETLIFSADYDGLGSRLSGGSPVKVVTDEITYSAMEASYAPYNTVAEWASGASYSIDDLVRYKGWLCISRTNHTATVDDQPIDSVNGNTNWFKYGTINREIPGCPTSHFAIAPHPTDGNNFWKAEGTTPALFESWFRKTVNAAIVNDGPRIVTIYNVSEWTEGGPGLVPNISDGWGYLDAVKNVLTGGVEAQPITNKQNPDIVGYKYVIAGSTIPSRHSKVYLDEAGVITLTSTPTIEAGVDGQELTLMHIGANSVTLQDDGTLANSDLFLSASTIVLSPYDSITLQYVDGKGWVQIAQVNVL
jgi:hypothetical protein